MTRKLPLLTHDNRAFWQGGAKNVLNINRCKPCARYFHPPAPLCPICASFDIAPHPVSGKGKVYSFTINHQKWSPNLEVPFIIAIVELDEQPSLRFLTNIIDCPPSAICIDMPVEVRFEHHSDVWLPMFTPTVATGESNV